MIYKQSQTRVLFLLIILISISQCGLALYLPSLPSIALDFKAAPSLVQLTVVYYVLGIGLSQLIYGPWSDAYGRKPTVPCGLSIFLLGTLFAIFAKSIYLFLAARLCQGIGMGAASTISRAVLRDVFKDHQYIQAGSRLAGAVALTPIMAPVLGGYIQLAYGWRAVFYILLIMSMITLVCWTRLFNESNNNRFTFSISTILKNYSTLLKSNVFIRNVMCGSLIYAGEVIFLSVTPFLIQVTLKKSSSTYGVSLCFIIFGYILGTRLSAKCSRKVSSQSLIFLGILCSTLGSFFMLILGIFYILNLISILLPLTVFMFGAGFIYPNTSLMAIEKFHDKAGTASALFSSWQGLFAALAGSLTSIVHSNTLTSMACILLVLCVSALCLLFFTNRKTTYVKY